MSDARYLILTKVSDPNDIKQWGVAVSSLGLVVEPDGTVRDLPTWDMLPECACPLLVLNMTFDYLAKFLRDCIGKIEQIVGASARVWVHFGDINSAEMNVQTLCECWSREEYDPFRRFTKHPKPYSQTASAEFDKYVKELSGKIEDLHGGDTRKIARLTDMNEILVGLDRAWKMANARFPDKDIERGVDASRELRMAQGLMPVFIYLDGLLYASEKAEDRLEEMAKVVRECVPEELGAIAVETASAHARDIAVLKDDLSSIGTVDLTELIAMGKQFCEWYKDFLRDVMPVPAATGETTRGTRP